jgi:hypothetical protein
MAQKFKIFGNFFECGPNTNLVVLLAIFSQFLQKEAQIMRKKFKWGPETNLSWSKMWVIYTVCLNWKIWSVCVWAQILKHLMVGSSWNLNSAIWHLENFPATGGFVGAENKKNEAVSHDFFEMVNFYGIFYVTKVDGKFLWLDFFKKGRWNILKTIYSLDPNYSRCLTEHKLFSYLKHFKIIKITFYESCASLTKSHNIKLYS